MNTLELNLELYRKMYLIRKAEENIRVHYPENEMKTPVHLSLGEEAIVAGVSGALGKDDQIFGTYRCHGIYLARTGETDKFFAELYGKKTGLAGGRAGSMHLTAPESGLMGTSALVGSIIPVAIGASFANKRLGNGKITAVFFGDGALEEGVFWESLNAAALMKLPIIFVCEDNELAAFTHKSERHGYGSIVDIVSKFNCRTISETTTDVEKIYNLTKEAMNAIARTGGPYFLHLRYYRYLEHVGVCEDFDCGYRSRDEFEKWFKVDPVGIQREKLLRLGLEGQGLEKIEHEIDAQIGKSIKLAQSAEFPDEKELYEDVYG